MNAIQKSVNNRYRKKYKHLKSTIKTLLIENAALCDEVCKLQTSIQIVKEERKFLLHKLLEYENSGDCNTPFYYHNESKVISFNGSQNAKVKKWHSLEGGKI